MVAAPVCSSAPYRAAMANAWSRACDSGRVARESAKTSDRPLSGRRLARQYRITEALGV